MSNFAGLGLYSNDNNYLTNEPFNHLTNSVLDRSRIFPGNLREKGGKSISFDPEIDKREIDRRKQRAKKLRQSAWWQRKVAKGVCYYCERKVDPGELTMDHVVPLTRGGKSTKGNLVPACKDCNNKKKYLLPIEWDEYLQGLTHRES